MSFKACIFDLDGTLLDTINTIAYYGNNALEAFGYKAIDSEEYKYFAGNGARILIERMLAFSGVTDEAEIQKVLKKYLDEYDSDTRYKTAVFDGINDLLCALRENGLKCAVLSNKPHNATLEVIEYFFGENVFDVVYGQREGYPIKPDPTVAIEIGKEFGATPDECLYVGDTAIDMETGKGAGYYTIGVLWGFRKRDELLKSGADVIVSHPREIAELLK